jgi:hypothetical protein
MKISHPKKLTIQLKPIFNLNSRLVKMKKRLIQMMILLILNNNPIQNLIK